MHSIKIRMKTENASAPAQESTVKKRETTNNLFSLKALSIHPVYSMLIVTGNKPVECRSWTISCLLRKNASWELTRPGRLEDP